MGIVAENQPLSARWIGPGPEVWPFNCLYPVPVKCLGKPTMSSWLGNHFEMSVCW